MRLLLESALVQAAFESGGQSPDVRNVLEVPKLLGDAQSPLIHAGGGVIRSGAWDELLTLAERLQAPVVMTTNGKGAVSDRHYLGQSQIAGPELTPRADVILAVGTRFVDILGQPRPISPGQTLIRLDIDEEEIERNQPAERVTEHTL